MNKVETLEYGFEVAEPGLMVPSSVDAPSRNMYLDSPSDVFKRVIDGHAGTILRRLDPLVTSGLTPDRQDGMRVVVDFDKIKQINDTDEPFKRITVAKDILGLLDSFYDREVAAKKDPFITITRAINIAQGGKSEMVARIILPPEKLIEDEKLADVATAHMLVAAEAFKYKPHRRAENLVFATVNRESGVSFHVDSSVRHRSFSTSYINPDAGSFNLLEKHLINDIRRVICFAGVVAVASQNRILPNDD